VENLRAPKLMWQNFKWSTKSKMFWFFLFYFFYFLWSRCFGFI